MTPRADLVARLLRELVTLVRGECPALLNEDSGGDARLSLAIDDALAALPPPADPQLAPTLPKSMADHVVGMDRDGNLLVKVSNMNAAGNTDTGIYAFSLPRPADPPALVALRRSLLTGLEAIRQFASPHAAHTNRCNGDDDTPCDCGAVNPRDVAEALYEQVLAYPLPAAPPVTDTPQGDQCRVGESMADDYFQHAAECPECSAYEAARVEIIRRHAAPTVPPQEGQ